MYKSRKDYNDNCAVVVTIPTKAAQMANPYKCPKCDQWHEKTDNWQPVHEGECNSFTNLCNDCAEVPEQK